MKKLILLVMAAAFIGCSATNTVTMSVQEPAPVDLPPHMKRIGIVDRSQSAENDRILDKIDRVLSAEGKNLDKDGAGESITGLAEELKRNERLDLVTELNSEDLKLGNPEFGAFPNPVSWDTIEEICEAHQLDGLFSLEFYDTDTEINYDAKKTTIKGPVGLEIPALEHHAVVNTVIKTGWRIYDSAGRHIIDEFVITEQFTSTGKGVNPVEAVSAITGRKETVLQISNEIGRSYAQSVIPYWTRVKRQYFVKGNDNFEIAKRRAQTGNWEGAGELWLKETKNPKSKIAGRATYNMAIISEINGEIEEAMAWARKSYEDYSEKRALGYLRILENRKARMQVLKRQQQ